MSLMKAVTQYGGAHIKKIRIFCILETEVSEEVTVIRTSSI